LKEINYEKNIFGSSTIFYYDLVEVVFNKYLFFNWNYNKRRHGVVCTLIIMYYVTSKVFEILKPVN